jgi:hypothetical protein
MGRMNDPPGMGSIGSSVEWPMRRQQTEMRGEVINMLSLRDQTQSVMLRRKLSTAF